MSSTTWPPIGYEPHLWTHRDPMASRRARLAETGSFSAATVPRIADLTPSLPRATAEAAHAATQAMAAFGIEADRMAALPFSAVLLRGESASSSQIENLTVHARKLSLAAVGARVGGNAELVARNVTAMKAAVDAVSGRDIVLSAQSPLAGWYAKFGFEADGEEFLEDGIPHTPMRRRA